MARIARKTKTIICILFCCVLVMAHMGTCRKLRAEALPDVLSGSSTIADIVLTYYSTVGAGISNIEWINTLNNSLGSNFGTIESFVDQGYLLQNEAGAWEPAQELVSAIENTSAYQSLGLDQIFNVSAQEAAAGGGLAASGAATLAGAAGGVASIGALPLFAGVTASYWAGIGAGTLINHLTSKYEKNIYAGVNLDAFDDLSVASGSRAFEFSYSTEDTNYKDNRKYLGTLNGNGFSYARYISNNILQFGFFNTDSKDLSVIVFNILDRYDKNNSTNQKTVSQTNGYASKNNYYSYSSGLSLGNQNFSNIKYNASIIIPYGSNFNNYISDWQNGNNIPSVYSPDLIGSNGNQQAQYDSENQKYTVPDFKPQIDPGTEAGKVLSLQDWLSFANSVNNNNSQVDPLPDNAKLFQDLIDALKIGLPSPGPNPNPNPNPDPNPNPNPTPVPDPDYGDPNPDQPDWEDPTEVPDPVDTGNPWRLPDLSKKFPFCIPWDIGKMFGKLKVNAREAPHIQWRFNPPGTPVDYTFDLDLEDYEEVAALLRSLELIAFIVGLAFTTRYLIGAT